MTARCSTCCVRHYPACTAARRWPAEPLLEVYGQLGLARRLDQSVDAIHKAGKRGLSDRTADLWATRCGLHPTQVWPTWIEEGLTVTDARFIEHGWRQSWLFQEAKA